MKIEHITNENRTLLFQKVNQSEYKHINCDQCEFYLNSEEPLEKHTKKLTYDTYLSFVLYLLS